MSENRFRRPTYEGRPLPRPDDEVVDQGLAFDVATLMSRRRLLGLFGAGAGSALLAACGSSTGQDAASNASSSSSSSASRSASASSLTEIPDETAGPYPGDGSNGPDVLEESGIVRRDIRSSFGASTTTAAGVPLTIEFTILDMVNDDAPMVAAAVYAWHCDRDGNYSMYADSLKNENYLRGVQVTDASGKVSFTSIFPACYSGRWPHVHFEVYPDQASIDDSTKAIATSQMALPKDVLDVVYATDGYAQSVTNLSQVTLATDNVFGNDSAAHQVATVTGSVDAGYVAALTAPIDTSTTPAGGEAPVNGGGGAPPTGAP